MTMKKMFSAVSAAALLTAAVAATAVNASAETETDVLANAVLSGQMGTYSQWDAEAAAANNSTIAAIDGNAQYEATWNITGDGTASIEFLILEIRGTTEKFTKDTYQGLGITIDEIYIDGESYAFTANDAAINYKYYESDVKTGTRVYLTDAWGINEGNTMGVASDTVVTSEIKVIFTISGLYNDGTSNVTETTKPTDPTDPTDPAPEYTLGDVNNDAAIDAVDASSVLSEYALIATKAPTTFTETQSLAADVNKDGNIDAVDASKILSYYAEKATGGNPSFD